MDKNELIVAIVVQKTPRNQKMCIQKYVSIRAVAPESAIPPHTQPKRATTLLGCVGAYAYARIYANGKNAYIRAYICTTYVHTHTPIFSF
jgi:hypothetical protein